MDEVPLSLHVNAKLKEELEQEASLLQVSESEIAEKAIGAYLDYQSRKREVIAAAAAEADKGIFISSEAVLDWMEQLEADLEAPPPKPDTFFPPRHR